MVFYYENFQKLGSKFFDFNSPPKKKPPKVMKQGVCHIVCDLAIYI
jgi:hypothetical protein